MRRPLFPHEDMPCDPDLHRRRSIRLPDYDYARPGVYCVAICSYGKISLFGDVVNSTMRLSDLGKVVQDEWLRTPSVRSHVELDRYVIMPNHVHGIIKIVERRGVLQYAPTLDDPRHPFRTTGPRSFRSPSQTLGAVIRGFKGAAAKRINARRGTPGAPVWQRNYYEHVVRDAADWARARQYIDENPERWALDEENPSSTGPASQPLLTESP